MIDKLPLGSDTALMVLTGAGISAESGIPTFRGDGGMWNGLPAELLASPEGFERDPGLVWRFYCERRANVKRSMPNAGHRALAKLQIEMGSRLLLATQNVDGLHFRAGSVKVVELHGNIFLTKCSNPNCFRKAVTDFEVYPKVPMCSECRNPLRPGVVWFGENLDKFMIHRIQDFIKDGKRRPFVFLAVGTQGAVEPASMMVRFAKAAGATTVLVNLEKADNEDAFDVVYHGKAGDILPAIL